MDKDKNQTTKTDLNDKGERESSLGYGGRDIPVSTNDGQDEES